MRLRSASAVLLAAALFAGAAGARPQAQAVVGGTAISVTQAPWTVYVTQEPGNDHVACTGIILTPSLVLTAAHCVFDEHGTAMTAADMHVEAGVSDAAAASDENEQAVGVTAIRVHPGYAWTGHGGPDDVAMLTLGVPLDLSGPYARAVALPAPGSAYPAGSAAVLAGFGLKATGAQPDATLSELKLTVDAQGACGGGNVVVPSADAVALCATAPNGSICNGDSGSGLVTASGTPTLIGVTSATPNCQPGSHGIYTYVGAAEILKFIQGDDQPPTAPRESPGSPAEISWYPPLVAGATLTCSAPTWTGGQPDSLRYVFATSTGAVLQQGASSTFVPGAGDVGDEVTCSVLATNAGGTSVQAAGVTPAIRAAPASAAPGPKAAPRTATRSAGEDVTSKSWNARTIELKASMIPSAKAPASGSVAVPQWDGYLRLALLGDQDPSGPRYRNTYVRCYGSAAWAAASAKGTRFAAGTTVLGSHETDSAWIGVPASTCEDARLAAMGKLDAPDVVALGTVLHETLDRQGLADTRATCLGAVTVWHAVDRASGSGPAGRAFSLLLRWYGRHLTGAGRTELRGCGARLGSAWNSA